MHTMAEYPFTFALAYLLIVGSVSRALFVSLRLPGAVGLILSGMLLSHFMQQELYEARDTLQELAFFLVLLAAGFEISLPDIKPYVLVMACLPLALEMVAIALTACYTLGFTAVQGATLATSVCALGDGLVIPKMLEMVKQYNGHPLPKMVFLWAPLEASIVLTTFGIVQGLAHAAEEPEKPTSTIVAAATLNVVLTLLFSLALGKFASFLISRRTELVLNDRQVFNGTNIEALVLVCGIVLAAFSVGQPKSEDGGAFIPIGITPGPAISSELCVIATCASFSHVMRQSEADTGLLHGIEQALSGVWVVGQIVLFSMLGSKTDPSVFAQSGKILPIMFAGLAARFFGFLLGISLTQSVRTCSAGCPHCRKSNALSTIPDALFCFLATLPRATIQGALAGIPMARGFFSNESNSWEVNHTIAAAGKLYIVILSIFGSLALEFLGPRLLELSEGWGQMHDALREVEQTRFEYGWTSRLQALLSGSVRVPMLTLMSEDAEPLPKRLEEEERSIILDAGTPFHRPEKSVLARGMSARTLGEISSPRSARGRTRSLSGHQRRSQDFPSSDDGYCQM